MRTGRRVAIAIAVLVVTVAVVAAVKQRSSSGCGAAPAGSAVIDHVADGDTVVLCDGATVRLVQIDTPEVYFGVGCYGPQASAITKRLLPPGAAVRERRSSQSCVRCRCCPHRRTT